MQQYTLRVTNNSTNVTDLCVYQIMPPAVAIPPIMATAWMTAHAYPSTVVEFKWEPAYQFMWCETGDLKPGIIFSAGQTLDGDLTANNMVTLHYDAHPGAYTFDKLTANADAQGSLVLQQDGSIPLKQAAVGIGVHGSPICVCEAQPNVWLICPPEPVYWLTFGHYTQGQVLNTGLITNRARIEFPPNVYSMTAALDANNVWTVTPGNA